MDAIGEVIVNTERRLNELRKRYKRDFTAECRYRILECERFRKILTQLGTRDSKEVSNMKCPECGAPTEVKETRMRNGNVYRKRICFNYHKIKTEERPVGVDAGGVSEVVALHETRPKAVSKGKEVRPAGGSR